METVIVGSRYQIVIPKRVRRQIKAIKPGAKVVVKARGNGKIEVEPDKSEEEAIKDMKAWIKKYAGSGTEAWKDVEATEYIRKLRDEWEERLKKLNR